MTHQQMNTPSKEASKRGQYSWALFDWANQPFFTVITTFIFSQYFANVMIGDPIKGRGDHTHLALVRIEESGFAYPLEHSGSAMLRGLARADGFAVIEPGTEGVPGTHVPFVPVPLLPGGRP